MTREECKQLVDAYVEWLRRGLSVEGLDGACELTTPFLDRHNDHLQVYAVRRNGKIVLSDDGYILSDLRASGLELITPKRESSRGDGPAGTRHSSRRQPTPCRGLATERGSAAALPYSGHARRQRHVRDGSTSR